MYSYVYHTKVISSIHSPNIKKKTKKIIIILGVHCYFGPFCGCMVSVPMPSHDIYIYAGGLSETETRGRCKSRASI